MDIITVFHTSCKIIKEITWNFKKILMVLYLLIYLNLKFNNLVITTTQLNKFASLITLYL